MYLMCGSQPACLCLLVLPTHLSCIPWPLAAVRNPVSIPEDEKLWGMAE